MSLIEEALRKQREEEERANPVNSTLPPAEQETPPPLPEETPEVSGAHRPWPILAGLAAAGLAAVLLICALLYFGLKLWHQQPAPDTAKANPATVEPVKAPIAPPAAAPIPSSPAAHLTPPVKEIPVASKPETQVVTSASGPTVPAPTAPVTTSTSVAAKPSVEKPTPAITNVAVPAPVTTQAATLTPPPAAVPEKAIVPVIWPRLSVSGIIGNNRTKQSAAIINGQFVSPGDNVEGAKVIAVDRQRVTLSYGGETRTLSAGTTTE